jgi:hypothetical protein
MKCQNQLIDSVEWTPKLLFENEGEEPCALCGTPTSISLMFEKTEVYPGFYTNETK